MASTADPAKNTNTVEAADETTPLLGAPESAVDSHGTNNGEFPTKGTSETDNEEERMPYAQIFLLCYASIAEPVAYFGIFPFINEMIERNGHLDEENVGFWSGMIESLFSLVQMVLMIFYGRLADRLGRKPILVWSLAGVSVTTALFGLSRTLWQMILLRCLAGTFAGSVVTMRTMISENTTKASQGRAFSWYMFARNLGIFIGPLIGGGLADPAEQFPNFFGDVQFFIDYPYALSTFCAGAICLTGTMTSLLFIKETLKRKDFASGQPEPPMSTWAILNSPGVPIILYTFGHVMLLGLAYTAVAPVFQFTSVEKGGFAFPPYLISYFIAIGGASQALWMILAFPGLQRRFGTGSVLRGTAAAWPFFMGLYPILNEFLRNGWNAAFWIVSITGVVLGSGVAMGFTCVQLCLNDIAPSHTVLATLNALALTVNSGIRAVAPALFTSIYAFGVKIQWADGHLCWFILIALAAALNIPLRFLPEAAEGRPDQQKADKKSTSATEDQETTPGIRNT
ncbi:uncharacterized protein MYCFIDRAFT_45398 [Pseudocercospora fijiensis CIRAD86]|uniref:Major facilitator superfamily (MFS) profile domain-containing protein n=1 Tax=Pseudocercospora fijiensis (strain CIRAD86) TaxID=383855 RepID=M3A5G2_PSEFD|nr:uncharacterized protein MYCFIDRAFT_45398 [Pseudocercospora fijiensis CIRAD86]EME86364.1 hypothetical protein MYCFIDRAFT_45398 [Pseudocercospora fijiensis CIRAD86]